MSFLVCYYFEIDFSYSEDFFTVHSGVRSASFATKVETLGAVNWEQGGL